MILLSIFVTFFLVNAASSVFGDHVKRSWEISNWANRCSLPPCPKHANYEVTGVMETWHGDKWPTEVVYTCWPGYTLVGSRVIECYDGRWSGQTPQCVVSSPGFPSQYPRQQLVSHMQQFVPHHHQSMLQPQQSSPYPQHTIPQPQLPFPNPQQTAPYPQHIIPQHQLPLPNPQEPIPPPQLPSPNPQQSAPYPQQPIPQTQLPLPNPQQPIPQPQLPSPNQPQSAPYPQQSIPQTQLPLPNPQQPVPQPQLPFTNPQRPVSQMRPFIPQQSCVNCCSCDDISQMKQLLPQQQQPQTLRGRGKQLKKTSEATGGCILPPYPGNGTYKLTTVMNPVSSNQRLTANLTYTCSPEKIREGPLFIICLAGKWSDNFPYCRERGPNDPAGSAFSVGGTAAELSELPWHVGIYDKSFMPYMQICGGSVISKNRVISAAHCFWDDLEMLRPASEFAVGAGKLYRAWDDQRDNKNAQQVDVRELKVPPRYQHLTASYQEDIALLTVATDFMFDKFVMPAILDFNTELDSKHLQEGNLGMVGGWGLITEDGKEATVLQVVMLPYVGIEKCIAENEPGFRNYITADKICAGFRNGTAVCMGDSGGGLVYTEEDNGNKRFYLRGVVSTAPTNDNACNIYAWTTFTHLLRQDHFIEPLIAA